MISLRTISTTLFLLSLSNCAARKLDPNTVDLTQLVRALDRKGVQLVDSIDQERTIREQIKQKEAADSAIAAMRDETGIRQLNISRTVEGNGVSLIAFTNIEQRDRWIRVNPASASVTSEPFVLPLIRCGTLVVVFTPRVLSPSPVSQRDAMKPIIESLISCPNEVS